MNIELQQQKESWPSKVKEFYDTKDSKIMKMELIYPLYILNKWSGQIMQRNTYILTKRMVERGKL